MTRFVGIVMNIELFIPCIFLYIYIYIYIYQQILTYIITYLLTPWSRVLLDKLNGSAASQEIPRILWNPKIHYHIHKCSPPIPVLSQLDPVHTPISHSLKIHLNIILPSKPGSPKWSPSLKFPHQNPVHPSPLPHTLYIPRPSHSSRFYHTNNIG